MASTKVGSLWLCSGSAVLECSSYNPKVNGFHPNTGTSTESVDQCCLLMNAQPLLLPGLGNESSMRETAIQEEMSLTEWYNKRLAGKNCCYKITLPTTVHEWQMRIGYIGH